MREVLSARLGFTRGRKKVVPRGLVSFLGVGIFAVASLSIGQQMPIVHEPPLILGQGFLQSLRQANKQFNLDDGLCVRLLSEFGAVFLSVQGTISPPTYLFPNESSVDSFQAQLPTSDLADPKYPVELQRMAAEAMKASQEEAKGLALSITPASKEAGRRSYAQTVELWENRVGHGIEHWVAANRLRRDEADRLLALAPSDQVREVLRLEDRQIYFSKGFDKTILYSVAAPGTSQHLSMLAMDIREHEDARIRAILSRHGWFQTVYSDLPHFTYLGVPDTELPRLGLVTRQNAGHTFWIVSTDKTRGAPPGEPDVVEECPF
jgi:hypothetical protein